MSANNLGRINNSRFEANYQSIISTAKLHFSLLQAHSLRNPQISGLKPMRSQLF